MGTERFLSILDEITDAGCLFLLLTGGDPLLRDDFEIIYRRAKNNGLLLTVFTNGTLLTDKIIGLFRDLPPLSVEISLYGSSAETYEKVTGIRGSFDRCMAGIEGLIAHNISVSLKTMLMTLNIHELQQMKHIADGFGVKFRFDPAISPCLNGDTSPLQLRVKPEEAVEREFGMPDRMQDWKKYLEKSEGYPPPDELYSCGAGLYHFHIDPYGNLQACMMSSHLDYNLFCNSFLTGWRDIMPRVRELKLSPESACRKCTRLELCNFCPPSFELENDGGSFHSQYHCALSKQRLMKIQSVC